MLPSLAAAVTSSSEAAPTEDVISVGIRAMINKQQRILREKDIVSVPELQADQF